MRLIEIEKKAKGMGIQDTWKFSRKELIREIQLKEGNASCFDTGRRTCPEVACCWRSDCVR
jgi:hypothetical protein